jgi:hypothetical protein
VKNRGVRRCGYASGKEGWMEVKRGEGPRKEGVDERKEKSKDHPPNSGNTRKQSLILPKVT